jgi:hypothetical protein
MTAILSSVTMAQKRNEERRHQHAIDIGRANLALIPRIEKWCNHLKIRQTSGGLLGEMTGLPIGMMAIDCPHAKGSSIQAMQLHQVAASFVLGNCRGCPHHEELNADNVGREILRAADTVVAEERAEAARLSESATQLRSLVRGDLSIALKTAPTTEESVLECVARLDDPKQAHEAAELLVQAAALAPEFFNELACKVIAEHFSDVRCSTECIETLRTLGEKRGGVLPVALATARRCLESAHCNDAVLDLLADDYAAGGELPSIPSVAHIIRLHGYDRSSSIHAPPVANDGQTRALLAIGRRDLERLVLALNRILEEPSPHVRISAPIAIGVLLDELPAIGPGLLGKLAASLRLDDSEHGEASADVRANDALAHIFTYYPAETRAALESAAAFATDEVQKLLVGPYDRLARGDFKDLPPGPARDRHEKALVAAMDALMPFITDASRPLEAREKAAETVSYYGWEHPALVLDRLDSVLGALALVITEHQDFIEKNPGGDPALKGFPRRENQQYERIARLLRDAVDRVIGKDAARVFRAVSEMIRTLSSANKAQELLKWHLVELFEKLARDQTLGPQVIPPLYLALMDVQSVMVRARALQVIADLLPRHEALIPDNMREMAIIYLRDNYVGIHQGAAKVMGGLTPATREQASEILGLLMSQYLVYARDKKDQRNLAAVTNSIVRICRHYPEFFPRYALPLLLKQAESPEEDAARDALEELKAPARKAPLFETRYVKDVLGYFRRFLAEHDDWEHNPGHRLFRFLFECSRASIAANEKEFEAMVGAVAKTAGYDSLQFLPVLLHHECYDAAARCAALIAEAQPPGQREEWIRDQALLIQASAKAEAAVKLGNPAAALALLEAEAARAALFAPKPTDDDPKAFIHAYSMAHKVSERIK